MTWPELKSTIACVGSEKMFQLVLQEKFSKPLKAVGLVVDLLELEKTQIIPNDGFLYGPSWINIFLNEEFIRDKFQAENSLFIELTSSLGDIFDMIGREQSNVETETIRSATYSFFYKQNDGKILLFQLHNNESGVLKSRAQKIFSFIYDLVKGNTDIKLAIEKSYSFNDKNYYVGYQNEAWKIVDPLLNVAETINSEYKKHADLRVHKPDVILQEDNLNKRYTFGKNWILEFDGLTTLLDRPNDVGLYSSICQKNLVAAKKFYDETILIRHKYYMGNFPIAEQQVEYFDYFELITTALIFSFSSIEAFVNSFIPDDYSFTRPGGTAVMDKSKIERTLPLTYKLKNILTDIYQTTNPETEDWWQDLAELQELRDQTIHTKQHFSQQRYSRLLSNDIFKIIGVYEVIINYYGEYIKLYDRHLINDFPYNFGFDQIYPSLMSERTFKDIYNDLHNPSNPL